MKKLSLTLAFVAVLSTASAVQAALHTISAGDTITVSYGLNYRTGSGGEFQLGKVNAPADSTYFHTFCAETGEHLGSGTYYVASVGFTSINQGGILKEDAANLYRDYYDAMVPKDYGYQNVSGGTYTGPGNNSLDFTLGGFTFDMSTAATRAASGASIQNVLWNMLGYGNSLSFAEAAIKTAYASYIGSGNFRDVRIANLVEDGNRSVHVQDQFVVVPEAATIAVWSVLGLIGACVAYRKQMAIHA